MGEVAVLMGGWSAEREISLKTGAAVLDALRRKGIDAHGIDVRGAEVIQSLRAGGYRTAFIALHGRGGEDGVIQGVLEVLGIAYTGSDVLGCALSMDKLRTKQIWIGAGLPTPPFEVLRENCDAEAVAATVGLPLIVKPVREGSSIGMTRVERASELPEACELARRYDDCVIAERWITGSEYTVGILGERALPVIRLETPRAFYDYEAKYLADTTRYHIPCGMPAEREREIQALSLRAFEAVGCSGWGRADLMVDREGTPWLIEVNSVPGMTDHSLVPMAARAAGIEFDDLVLEILHNAGGHARGVQPARRRAVT